MPVLMEGRSHMDDGRRSPKLSRTVRAQSSNTAPHFGHFASVSDTSAPQFVHVKAVTFAALPRSRSGFVRSFGIGSSPDSIARWRVFPMRMGFHHMNRMTKKKENGMSRKSEVT